MSLSSLSFPWNRHRSNPYRSIAVLAICSIALVSASCIIIAGGKVVLPDAAIHSGGQLSCRSIAAPDAVALYRADKTTYSKRPSVFSSPSALQSRSCLPRPQRVSGVLSHCTNCWKKPISTPTQPRVPLENWNFGVLDGKLSMSKILADSAAGDR